MYAKQLAKHHNGVHASWFDTKTTKVVPPGGRRFLSRLMLIMYIFSTVTSEGKAAALRALLEAGERGQGRQADVCSQRGVSSEDSRRYSYALNATFTLKVGQFEARGEASPPALSKLHVLVSVYPPTLYLPWRLRMRWVYYMISAALFKDRYSLPIGCWIKHEVCACAHHGGLCVCV